MARKADRVQSILLAGYWLGLRVDRSRAARTGCRGGGEVMADARFPIVLSLFFAKLRERTPHGISL